MSGVRKAACAALYVDPDGPYPSLVADWYDEARDAKTYAGPLPVVAHPPCGPWGALRFLCRKQDPSCGPHAVEMVQRWGGVLEHPAYSTLWRACDLSLPGWLPDAHGGRTYYVRQVSWGHCCSKPTWLYIVGCRPEFVLSRLRDGGTPTHQVTTGPRGSNLPVATKERRRRTPLAFAQFLIEIALECGRRTLAAGHVGACAPEREET